MSTQPVRPMRPTGLLLSTCLPHTPRLTAKTRKTKYITKWDGGRRLTDYDHVSYASASTDGVNDAYTDSSGTYIASSGSSSVYNACHAC
ncbi:hypothetical protein DL89DRAFT_264335 [Linderina pennispora]|uniref:Uncharacterized protein n=1 Tax=Linderina pennispora TaxID=61395 RepID=A0A1Y1WLW3_9FUNG|nr:uncharacterized protein DL89DRAFT_264335 [Linderina pennispora]ORX74482.1 hypothetical protein DL89DRAFT_264335 [Linderina pennispora]